MNTSQLKKKASELSTSPGVYLMKHRRGEIIYVGKAKILKRRVQSYFTANAQRDGKTKALVKEIDHFEVILTETEEEALLLERNLIRHHSPKYNVIFKDGKEYPLVRVDFNEAWPRIEKVRRKKEDGAKYYGPFSHGGYLFQTLKLIERSFPLIRCSRNELKNAKRPCNYYHMNMCLAPCAIDVDRNDYIQMIERGVDILQGNHTDVRKDLKKDMFRASDSQNYEKAATYRDQIQALEALTKRQTVVLRTPVDLDAFSIVEDGDSNVISVLFVRGGQLLGHENFHFSALASSLDETLSSFVLQFYATRSLPEEILVPEEILEVDSLAKAIDLSVTEKNKRPYIHIPLKGDKSKLLSIGKKNALFSQQDVLEKSRQKRRELEQLNDYLQLPKFPTRIECMDISNLQGNQIVGAISCFIDGRPAKKHYKRYKIKSLEDGEQNDFQSIYEVTYRRLKRSIDEDEDFPDLLVIDGGRQQLNKAIQARTDLKLSTPFIVALAKSRQSKADQNKTSHLPNAYERVYFEGQKTPLALTDGSAPFRVLTQIRDEAHRFVIRYHRKKRDESTLKSSFAEIPGIGPVLQERLGERYPNLEAAQQASNEELLSVRGLSARLIELLKTHSSSKA